MATIICHDVTGNTFPVAPEALLFRPAIYGIVLENNQALLQKEAETGLWHPLGAVLPDNQTPDQTIRHVFRQLTGINPVVKEMLYLEDRYLIDDDRRAWHVATLYYLIERPSATAPLNENSPAQWVPLDALQRHAMQFGYEAIQAGRLQLKL